MSIVKYATSNRLFLAVLFSLLAVVGSGSVLCGDSPVAPKSVNDILGETTAGRVTKGKTTQHIKPGGVDAANADFDALAPTNVRDITTRYGPGRTGTLPDGRTVTVRPGSSDGRPTLEIRRPNGRGDEIRYD